jgi:hypothetical protein
MAFQIYLENEVERLGSLASDIHPFIYSSKSLSPVRATYQNNGFKPIDKSKLTKALQGRHILTLLKAFGFPNP